MTETWKDIPGYEGRYQVSDQGRVRSVDRRVRTVSRFGAETTRQLKGKILKPQKHSAGYLQVLLGRDQQIVGWCVLAAFVGPRPNRQQCAHNDGNKHNNAQANLRWDTALGNADDRRRHGTSGAGGTNRRTKLTAAQVRIIRDSQEPQHVVAAEFSIAQASVSKIKLRQRWGAL